jgi:hypothetical protein
VGLFEHIVRGLGDGGRRRAGGSRYHHMIWSEPSIERFDRVEHGGMDHRDVEEAGRAWTQGHRCRDGDGIPIDHGIREGLS